ncbi:putative F-box protein At3g25750 [Spinacia oleracea]|uniref:F-box protein At3g25750 n=1 Tax=Spinacia oleracea TaxID=3562 RepID=A0ABM3QM45_SPIOL|nr:putative F-box protein At3g25750 [Spinacia oleracea]
MEMQSNHRRRVSWSDLPSETVQLIAQFISKVKDLQKFRAVCKEWRRSTLISAFLPHRIISDVPQKVISSSILLLRPPDALHFPPWMVLAVEVTKGVFQFFHPFSRTPLSDLPQNLDLGHFQSTQLTTGYHVVYDDNDNDNDNDNDHNLFSLYIKVVMCYTGERFTPSFRYCTMLTLSDGGRTHKSRPFSKYKQQQKDSCLHADDVIRYKGRTYGIDKQGSLNSSCWVDISHFCLTFVDCHFCGKLKVGRWKRLATRISSSEEKLYMIVPVDGHGGGPMGAINLQFKVYEIEHRGKRLSNFVWVEVTSFGDADQVLFVTRDYCFFVGAKEFPGCQLKDCIVFSDDAFPSYLDYKPESGWNYESKAGNKAAIYSLSEQGHYSLPIECFPGFPLMLWSPPPWVSQSVSSPLQSQAQSAFEEVEMIQRYYSEREEEEYSSASEEEEYNSESESEEQTTETLSTRAAQAQTTRSLPVVNDMEHAAEEALVTGNLDDAIVQTDNTEHLVQASVNRVVTFKFQGLDVESNHLPVLQNVWMKHGDIVEGSLIRSCDTKTMAFASLAKIILILQTNSGKTLTDDQAIILTRLYLTFNACS